MRLKSLDLRWRLVRPWTGLLLGCLALAVAVAGLAGSSGQSDRVVYFAAIRGSINPASANYLQTAIRKAEEARAEALVIELDTPGGLVSTTRLMTQAIENSEVPVVVYVTPAGASATSAGALLSLGAHYAVMAPGTNLGAAHPVASSGKEIPGAMGQKVLNDTAAFARGLAELRDRDPAVAEKVVSQSVSLTAQEALDKRMIDFIAPSRAELLARLDGRQLQKRNLVIRSQGAAIQEVEMTLGQKVLQFLADPNIAGLLISLGMLCLYVEITTPGIQVAGVLGGILLLVGFMSFQLLPIRTGGLLLIALGVVFLAAEMFVSTHGALAIGGTLAFVLGLIWVIDPASTSVGVSPGVYVSAGVGLLLASVLLAWATARSRALVRQTLREIGGGGALGLAGYTGHLESVEPGGRRGKALIRGETWDVELPEEEPGLLRVGAEVEVLSTQGFLAKVRLR